MAAPKWFNYDHYMDMKLAQLKTVDPSGGWNSKKLTAEMEEAGYKGEDGAYAHFNEYGMAEGVSPTPLFDVAYYLKAKADHCNAIMQGGHNQWTAGLVMEAIKNAGMNSAWEHYVQYGSSEGIATSAEFDTAAYLEEKTAQLNKTAENGRTDWSVADTAAAIQAAGMTAISHYVEYGEAELKAAGLKTEFLDDPQGEAGFDAPTDVQTLSLKKALAAQAEGALPALYSLDPSSLDVGYLTVADQEEVDGLINGAQNKADLDLSKLQYGLEDTVDNLSGVSGTALAGVFDAYGVQVEDSFANVLESDNSVVKDAGKYFVSFEYGAAAGKVKDNEVLAEDWVAWQEKGGSFSEQAYDEDPKGDATITVDNSAGDVTDAVDLSAFVDATGDLAINYEGSDGADNIVVNHAVTGTINLGAGENTITLGANGSIDNATIKGEYALAAEEGATMNITLTEDGQEVALSPATGATGSVVEVGATKGWTITGINDNIGDGTRALDLVVLDPDTYGLDGTRTLLYKKDDGATTDSDNNPDALTNKEMNAAALAGKIVVVNGYSLFASDDADLKSKLDNLGAYNNATDGDQLVMAVMDSEGYDGLANVYAVSVVDADNSESNGIYEVTLIGTLSDVTDGTLVTEVPAA